MFADENDDGLAVLRKTAEIGMLHPQFGAVFQLDFKWRLGQCVFNRFGFHNVKLGLPGMFVELNLALKFAANFSHARDLKES
jgi:hypothetical protein